jgi:hypothetical protein
MVQTVYLGSEPMNSAMAARSVWLNSLPNGGMTDEGPRGREVASNLDSMNDTGLFVMSVETMGSYP